VPIPSISRGIIYVSMFLHFYAVAEVAVAGVGAFLQSPFVSLIVAVLNGFLAFAVLTRNPRAILNRVYAFAALSIFWWAACEYMSRSSFAPQQALVWERMGSFGYILAPLIQLWFALYFVGIKRVLRIALGSFFTIMSVGAIAFVWFSDLVVAQMTKFPWGYLSVPGPLFPYLLSLFALQAGVAILLYLQFMTVTKERSKRAQALLLFLGVVVPVTIGFYTDGILPLIHQGAYFELGSLTTTLNILLIAWAMVRFGFLGVGIEIAAPFVLATLADAVFVLGDERKIVYVNRAAQKLASAEESALFNSNIKEFLPELPDHAFTSFFKQESYLMDAEGHRIPVMVLSQRIADLATGTRGNVITVQDLSEIKELQEREFHARSDAEALHRGAALIEAAAEGIFSVDMDFKINLWNKAMENLTGIPSDQIVGKDVSWGMDVTDRSQKTIFLKEQVFQKVMDTKKAVSISFLDGYFLLNKENKKVAVAVTASPLYHDNGKMFGVVAVVSDETKEFEADRTKSEFVSIASHQLRTPISTMKWFSELLMAGDAGPLATQQQEFMKEIYAGIGRMADLVTMLLNVSRIEQDKLAVAPEPTDIAQLIHKIGEELRFDVSKRGLTLEVQVKEKLPIVNVDPRLMRFVIENLMTNAMRYTPTRGTITVSAAKSREFIEVNVADTGMGIPQQEQEKVFQKFFRATNAKDSVPEGTGLGLFIAKYAVEVSGGKIWFLSRQGKGTVFSFTIPLAGSKAKEGLKQLS